MIGEDALDRLAATHDGHTAYRMVDGDDLAVIDAEGDHVAKVRLLDDESTPFVGKADADLLLAFRRTDSADRVAAFRRSDREWTSIDITVVPREPDVFDRLRGVFESDRLRSKSALILGLGSGGSFVARELARAGVGRFILIDHDRLEPSNVCRHELGLADVGRLKVNAMRAYILDRNPVAEVSAHSFHVDGTTLSNLIDLCRPTPDIVVCGTDNRESRLLLNRAALLVGAVALYGGVRRRAYAGQVLRVVPRLTPCYQCFIKGVPDVASDVEISSPSDARRIAYSDRPVKPEPGLSTDIAPVALMMAKLALIELTGDQSSPAFDSLRRDLVAPWFFWLNRREAGTQFEQWSPLGDGSVGPGILRWLGQYLERDEHCPACGIPEGTLAREDVAFFEA